MLFFAATTCLLVAVSALSIKFTKVSDNYPLHTFEAAGTVLGSGKDMSYLVVFGGYSGFPKVTKAVYQRKFGSKNAKWEKLAPMPYKITHLAQWSDGNAFCGVGGYDGDFPGTSGNRGFCYNRITNKYTALPNLPGDRAGGGLVLITHKGKKMFVYAGGVDRVFPSFKTHIDYGTTWTLEYGNPKAKWKKLAQDMPDPRNHMAAVESCGRYYFVGGQKKVDEQKGNSVTVSEFLAGSLTWKKKAPAPLPIPLGHVSASVMAYQCGIIIVGGITNGKKMSDAVFYYNSKTNKWSKIGKYPNMVATPVCGIRGDEMLCATGGEWKMQKQVFIGKINDPAGPVKQVAPQPKPKTPAAPTPPPSSSAPQPKKPVTTPKVSIVPPSKKKTIAKASTNKKTTAPSPSAKVLPASKVKGKKEVKVEVKKVEESDYGGPVKSLVVIVGGKNVYEMKDKGEIAVKTFGQEVILKANTGGTNVGKLYFEVGDRAIEIKGWPNYSIGGTWKSGEKLAVIVTHYTAEDKTEFKVEVTLNN